MHHVCIEASVNGPWTRRVQPTMPIAPDDIVKDSVACARAGASVIHFHAYDVQTGEQTTDLGVVTDIVKKIRDEVDVIVYPAIRYMSNAESIQLDAGSKRYAHLDALSEQGFAEWLIVDPGSTNLVSYRDIEAGRRALVDINTPDAIRFGLQVAAKHKLHPGFAIYEPGYLRLASALCRSMPGVPAPMYRFMFSEQFTFGFRPTEYALEAYLRLLNEEAPRTAWMVAGLGVDVLPLVPAIVRWGGHLRVGIEDARLGAMVSNLELVTEARREVERHGGALADVGCVRRMLQSGPSSA